MELLDICKEFTTNHTNQHELLPHAVSMFVMVRGKNYLELPWEGCKKLDVKGC